MKFDVSATLVVCIIFLPLGYTCLVKQNNDVLRAYGAGRDASPTGALDYVVQREYFDVLCPDLRVSAASRSPTRPRPHYSRREAEATVHSPWTNSKYLKKLSAKRSCREAAFLPNPKNCSSTWIEKTRCSPVQEGQTPRPTRRLRRVLIRSKKFPNNFLRKRAVLQCCCRRCCCCYWFLGQQPVVGSNVYEISGETCSINSAWPFRLKVAHDVVRLEASAVWWLVTAASVTWRKTSRT